MRVASLHNFERVLKRPRRAYLRVPKEYILDLQYVLTALKRPVQKLVTLTFQHCLGFAGFKQGLDYSCGFLCSVGARARDGCGPNLVFVVISVLGTSHVWRIQLAFCTFLFPEAFGRLRVLILLGLSRRHLCSHRRAALLVNLSGARHLELHAACRVSWPDFLCLICSRGGSWNCRLCSCPARVSRNEVSHPVGGAQDIEALGVKFVKAPADRVRFHLGITDFEMDSFVKLPV